MKINKKIISIFFSCIIVHATAIADSDLLKDGMALNKSMLELLEDLKKSIVINKLPINNVIKKKHENISKFIKTPKPYTELEELYLEYVKAEKLFKQNKKFDAIYALQKILDKNPNYHRARVRLIIYYLNNNQIDIAKSLIDAGLKIDMYQADYLLLSANILILNKEYKEVLAILAKIPENYKNTTIYYALAAKSYYNQAFYELAYQYYNKLALNNYNYAPWWLGCALSLQAQGKLNLAVQYYKKVLTINNATNELLEFARNEIKNIGIKK